MQVGTNRDTSSSMQIGGKVGSPLDEQPGCFEDWEDWSYPASSGSVQCYQTEDKDTLAEENVSYSTKVATKGNQDTLTETATECAKPFWLNRTIEKLDQLCELPENWNSYGGLPVNRSISESVKKLLFHFKDESYPLPDVIPGSGGEVQLEWQYEGRSLEVAFISCDKIEYLKEYENGTMEEGIINPIEVFRVMELLDWLKKRDN